jgi:exosortase
MDQRLRADDRPPIRTFLILLTAAVAGLIWAHWTDLVEMAQHWANDAQYSHGYLVPLFCLGLLWRRRDQLQPRLSGSAWWGLPVLALGIGLHLGGAYFYYTWLEALSLLPSLAGLVFILGGWATLAAWRWAWPAIGFLIFMIPLPYRFEVALAGPLQRIAVISSTYLLQTFGLPAVAEGNIILLSEARIGIVEACSGLRMLVVFFALSSAVALVIRRPFWEKAVVVASAMPIALVVNVMRITVTGFLHEKVSSSVANAVFHDFAGWLMMPVALGLLWLELIYLSYLLLEPPPAGPLDLGLATSAARPAAVH